MEHLGGDERGDKDEGQEFPEGRGGGLRRGRQGLAGDEPHEALDAGRDPTMEIACLEARRDRLVDDAARQGIRDHAFEAIPDLDPHPPIVLRDQEEHAVVHPLAPELPILDDADRIPLYRVGRRARDDEHGDLRALPGLELTQPVFQRLGLCGLERAGEIGHARREHGHGDLGPQHGAQAQRQDRQAKAAGRTAVRPDSRPRLGRGAQRDGAGAGAKSTVGAREISASSATVNDGLVVIPNSMAVRLDGNDLTLTLYS